MAKQVETTYGDALLQLAIEEGKLDSLYEEAQSLVEVLKNNEELIQILNHPQIDKEEKKKLIENIFADRLSKDMIGLLLLLVEKDHSAQTKKVLEYFIRQVKKEKNIGVASVVSAITLTDSQKMAIKNRLIETTSYDSMEISYDTDKSLIGGLVIRIEDRVVDSSIKTKIEKMSQSLV
ncbi:MAG: ATP synthase F1 subunit delta [Wujia sp.]